MGGRARDWFSQAERDLAHARRVRVEGVHEWACFACHQSAEKAVKASILAHGGAPWGHSVLALVEALPESLRATDPLRDAARALDKLYVPTRCPNGFDRGKPGDYFTDADSAEAIRHAETLLDFCRRRIPRS